MSDIMVVFIQGQGLSGTTPVFTWDGTVIEINGVPGPDLKGEASTVPGPQGPRGPTAFGLSVSSPITVTPGVKTGVMPLPYALTLTRWRLASDVATTATVKVWRQIGGEVTGSVLPTLTAETSATGTTLTGWNTTLEVGQVLYLEVVSNSAASHLTLILEGA
jgi:hypothetical protein